MLADAAIMALAMMVLFTLLSFLLFNPARELLEKRQQKIDDDLKNASESKEKMEELKEILDIKMNEKVLVVSHIDTEISLEVNSINKAIKTTHNVSNSYSDGYKADKCW